VPEAFQSVVAEATVRLDKKSIAQFMPLYYSQTSAPLQYSLQGEPWPLETNAYTILITMATEAQGEIKFSGNPDVSPTITHSPLTASDEQRGHDAIQAAYDLGMKLQNQNPINRTEHWSAVYDGRGTCRMGFDPKTSVVDTMLRVHGVKDLRIVDGSVLPSNTPFLAMPEVLMLAERAVDLILDVPTYPVQDLPPQISLLDAVAYENDAPSNVTLATSAMNATVLAVGCFLLLLTVSSIWAAFHFQRGHAETDVYVQA